MTEDEIERCAATRTEIAAVHEQQNRAIVELEVLRKIYSSSTRLTMSSEQTDAIDQAIEHLVAFGSAFAVDCYKLGLEQFTQGKDGGG